MRTTNFEECGQRYMNDPDLIAKWNYTGPTRLIPSDPKTQITTAGCKAVCGHGNSYYPWSTSSSTILTWVLPMIGNLLQAPFESNAFWRTVKAINRWLGSPMATLSYVLWNIEISGKCALFVDMSLPYDAAIPGPDSDFADLRDSFYLLMNLNQYKMKPLISLTKEAEGLLRICLFSKDLGLVGTNKTLTQIRRKLAQSLRSHRKRGAVPVFISTMWFLFCVDISIEGAFIQLGDNAQAHDLSLGLFMSWFPILILCSIVDRNPIVSDDIRQKLNKMVDLVCCSLQDPEARALYMDSLEDTPKADRMAKWIDKISLKAPLIKGEFFSGFAGQGRTRMAFSQ
ncbi:hypothetical protein BT63DRAFT_470237 [Microthyrium microscopicum]|uniref:Uncharacterized protein n=1 Tax=Microthyrium microscopicum TaxID=703497 RepID=A0A6A6UFI9_9PEZI|nr:hypothetical protein BT63DRAFT_470237 [Microthyrium microscopicum]